MASIDEPKMNSRMRPDENINVIPFQNDVKVVQGILDEKKFAQSGHDIFIMVNPSMCNQSINE